MSQISARRAAGLRCFNTPPELLNARGSRAARPNSNFERGHMGIVTVLNQDFFTAEDVAYLLQVTTRTLNRWAAKPETYPDYAEKLSPITLISGRRMYPAEKILAIYNETFCRRLSLGELRRELEAASGAGHGENRDFSRSYSHFPEPSPAR